MSIPKFITHACGQINDLNYSNSEEALEHSYYDKHSKFIEIDINLSADDKYVLIHDWDKTFEYLFGYKIAKPLTYSEFKELKIRNKYKTLALEDFLNFMIKNDDLQLVSDVKAGGNIRFFDYIKTNFPELLARIYFQCYDYQEYSKLGGKGATKLILSLYQENKINFELLNDFLSKHNVKYLSINKPRANSDFILSLNNNNITIITHTVNEISEFKTLLRKGVNSVFTDTLYI